MTGHELDRLLECVTSIAREAGGRVMQYYGTPMRVAYRQDQSPVTEADFASQAYIFQQLAGLLPAASVLCEEDSAATWQKTNKQLFWAVDPLDGTAEFIHPSPEFAVNIGLVENGRPVLGVVYAPAQEVLYRAHRDSDAQKFSFKHTTLPTVLRVAPSTAADLVVTVSRRQDRLHFLPFLQQVAKTILFMGSALKICVVAAGEAHVYPRFGQTGYWDTVAGQIVLERAGGFVLDSQALQAMRYTQPANPINMPFLAACTVQSARRLRQQYSDFCKTR